jgi:hypothetical protein
MDAPLLHNFEIRQILGAPFFTKEPQKDVCYNFEALYGWSTSNCDTVAIVAIFGGSWVDGNQNVSELQPASLDDPIWLLRPPNA